MKMRLKKILQDNKNVLISAHGNSLRALCKYLFNISNKELMNWKYQLETRL